VAAVVEAAVVEADVVEADVVVADIVGVPPGALMLKGQTGHDKMQAVLLVQNAPRNADYDVL